MLALSRAPTCKATPVRSRRSTVRVTAWAGDKAPWAGLLRIFTPEKYIESKEDWTGTGSNFTGKISHKPRKPFKDGFINKVSQTGATAQQQAETAQQQAETDQNGNPIQYISDAAERVVGHNFTGDETEPDWSKTGHKGYTGTPKRVKPHKDEGPFHNRVL